MFLRICSVILVGCFLVSSAWAGSQTGTASQINASAGNGSTSVTVPADATAVVALWQSFLESPGENLTSLTLNGVAFTEAFEISEGPTSGNAGSAVLANPATGTQTVAWTWATNSARIEGGKIVLVYLKDVNTSNLVRDADAVSNLGTTDTSITIDSASDDVVLGLATSYTPTNPAISGTVFINNALLVSTYYDVAEQTAGASTTTITMTNEDYSYMIGISIRNAAAGVTPKLMLLGVGP